MNDDPSREEHLARDEHLTREERLAAKLRENLRRRKVQARALSGGAPPLPKDGEDG